MREPAVTVRGLTKSYGPVPVLSGVDLDVFDNEIFALIGPNGAGKTTLIECTLGIRKDYKGEIRIFGSSPVDAEIKEKIGVHFESPFLVWNLKVGEMIALMASLYPKHVDIKTLIRQFGLSGLEQQYLRKLSKGQKQRVSICSAFLNDPKLVILDEPTSGLSPEVRAELWAILRKEKENGRTILFTTHYMEEAEKWADRIAILKDGRVVATGRPSELRATVIGTKMKVVCPKETTTAVLQNALPPGVTKAVSHPSDIIFYTDDPKPAANFLLERGVAGIQIGEVSLDDVYFALTGDVYVENKGVAQDC